MTGFEAIIPFLRPIEPHILDQEVSEICINPNGHIFIEREGVLSLLPGVQIDDKALRVAVKNIARRLGDDISTERPLLDSRLPDGSRVAAMLQPCSIGGTTLTIRKHPTQRFGPQQLMDIGTIPPLVLKYLADAIQERRNILISGGTATGKTTMLNALATFIDHNDRLFVIEDTAELHFDHPNIVRAEARKEQKDENDKIIVPGVTLRDLLKHALRHRPDRIIMGEVRGGEAFDLFTAMNTGHEGTFCTIHANNAEESITRLETCVLQANEVVPYHVIRRWIGTCIHLLLHIERKAGKRYVSQLLELKRFDAAKDQFELREVYKA